MQTACGITNPVHRLNMAQAFQSKIVFIDLDKLYAGKFGSLLLKNIQAAKPFILVLTPNSLDRLSNDHNGDDWIHKKPSSTGPPNRRRAIGALSAAIQSGIRQTSTSSHHRFSTRVGEHPPSTPSITPASSTDRNRRKHHTSVTTVYDRS
ncbi:hypothetical protein KIN20_034577 [Parelaphostrongylus tenuis]|uniref:Uncharacterized protein n=1 Tax=Parelaphostrongylus tenuis TaxID=148309 RepID=A0AAD5RAJ3_PARTN|nr:hypothetical protein KIN20_034577 [Parelaphostrongylus tenuis]